VPLDDERPPAPDATAVLRLDELTEHVPASPDPAGDVVLSVPPGTWILLARNGPLAGTQFALEGELTLVGRSPDADITLNDVTVSRHHVEFVRGDDQVTVRDLGSLNGTYLNGERIATAALSNQDTVQIGRFRLVAVTTGPATPGQRPTVPVAGRSRDEATPPAREERPPWRLPGPLARLLRVFRRR
jgi:pSer/pThr/pTyr-binding forkhead associated (FHA) protein